MIPIMGPCESAPCLVFLSGVLEYRGSHEALSLQLSDQVDSIENASTVLPENLMSFKLPILKRLGMLRRLLLALAFVAPLSFDLSCGFSAEWTEDINSAIEQAAEEDKDLLIFYTGSDWCPPCKLLEDEVLSQKEFLFEIDPHYLLVKLDFPQQVEQDPELKARNTEWATRFGVEGFPTVVLTDVSLKPYAFLGYEEGGFQNYLAMIEEARQVRITRDEKLKLAAAAEGTEKAKLLDEAIGGMKEALVRVYYPDVIEEIIELTPKNELGLRTKWNAQAESEMRKMMLADMLMVSRIERPDRAIAFIDEVLSEMEFPDQQKFDALQIKLSLVRQLQKPELVNSLMDEMLAIEGLTDDSRQRLLVKRLLLMVGAGQKELATNQLEESLKKFPGSPWLLLAKGGLQATDKNYKQAVSTYTLGSELRQIQTGSVDRCRWCQSRRVVQFRPASRRVAGARQLRRKHSHASRSPCRSVAAKIDADA